MHMKTVEMKKGNFKYSDLRDFAAIRKIQSGDQEAYSHIYNKYFPYILASMLSKTGSRTESEDLAMQVLERAFEKIGQYKVDSSFNAWISTIARNAANDYYRKSGRTLNTVSLDVNIQDGDSDDNVSGAQYEVASDIRNGEQELIRKEKHQAVRDAIAVLDKKSQEVIDCIYFQDLSYKETAEATGLSMDNVKVKLFRSKKVIKELLKA